MTPIFRRLAPGHYTTPDRRWVVRQWWVFEVGALRGLWRERRGLRVYRPFRTMRAAVAAAGRADGQRMAA